MNGKVVLDPSQRATVAGAFQEQAACTNEPAPQGLSVVVLAVGQPGKAPIHCPSAPCPGSPFLL